MIAMQKIDKGIRYTIDKSPLKWKVYNIEKDAVTFVARNDCHIETHFKDKITELEAVISNDYVVEAKINLNEANLDGDHVTSDRWDLRWVYKRCMPPGSGPNEFKELINFLEAK